ncbi:hypothetical protein HRbin25_00599 [bacterium HR25]|nr:hypothetical protein HRbin25_00599 [bacterium HR25]
MSRLLGVLLMAACMAALVSPTPSLRPAAAQSGWVAFQTTSITMATSYRVRACFDSREVEAVMLRVVFYDAPDAAGDSLAEQTVPGSPEDEAGHCWQASEAVTAPCRSRSARYGIASLTGGAGVLSLHLEEEGATGQPCELPTPSPTPSPSVSDGPGPAPSPTLTPVTAEEPVVFPVLVNGGFEEARPDGTPYGWRKVGGTLARQPGTALEGSHAAVLVSDSPSTKWAYQTVRVRAGTSYELRAHVLKDDPAAEEVWLSISWYASEDGSGQALSSHDSPQRLDEDGPAFRALSTGPATAPPGAHSARLRLMLRPRSAAIARAYFDAVSFQEVAAPLTSPGRGEAAGAGPLQGRGQSAPTGGASPTATPFQEISGIQIGATPLVNQRPPSPPAERAPGGRPWPLLAGLGGLGSLLLALAVLEAWRWWRRYWNS